MKTIYELLLGLVADLSDGAEPSFRLDPRDPRKLEIDIRWAGGFMFSKSLTLEYLTEIPDYENLRRLVLEARAYHRSQVEVRHKQSRNCPS